MKKKILLILLGGLCALTIAAQTVHNLNSQSGQGSESDADVPQEYRQDAKAIREFSVNPALQNANSVSTGDMIQMQLFEGVAYMAAVSDAATDVNGNFTLSLKLPGYPMASGFITTGKTGKSLFSVSVPELNQRFSSRGSLQAQTDFLVELSDTFEMPLIHDEREIPAETRIDESGNPEQGQLPDSERNPVACNRDPNLTGTDPATISLLIVYTPAAAAWAAQNQGGINNVIAGAMAQTKAVIDNQKNGDVMLLAHSQQVNYVEADAGKNMDLDLDRLTGTGDGFMDEVHQLRKQYNADIVSLFTLAHDYGGLGWLLGNATNGNYSLAFNIVRVQQAGSGTTLIHEIGHNTGMRHERDQYPASLTFTPLYPYAWGWYWTGTNSVEYGSVMSYRGSRTPYFSNPDESFTGKPTGTANANNAQVFRNTKHVVAFYSDKLGNLPEAPANVVVSSPTNNGATFSWDACDNATEYRFVFQSGGSWYSFTTPITTTSYVVNSSANFQPGVSYQFYIRALNACGDIVNGQTLTFTTRRTTDPTVVTSAATGITHNSATLNRTVTANGSAITGQGFMYKEMKGGTWQQNTGGNLTGLAPNTAYKFYAYGTNALGHTINGSVLTFTTATAPQTLEALMVSLTAGHNKVTVQPQAAAAGHAFYYSSSMTKATIPAHGVQIGTINGATLFTQAVDISGANGSVVYVQVYKVATGNNTIVGFGEESVKVGIPGDVNGDGVVNGLDITALLADFGKTGGAISNPKADVNEDGVVNGLDITALLANFGK